MYVVPLTRSLDRYLCRLPTGIKHPASSSNMCSLWGHNELCNAGFTIKNLCVAHDSSQCMFLPLEILPNSSSYRIVFYVPTSFCKRNLRNSTCQILDSIGERALACPSSLRFTCDHDVDLSFSLPNFAPYLHGDIQEKTLTSRL